MTPQLAKVIQDAMTPGSMLAISIGGQGNLFSRMPSDPGLNGATLGVLYQTLDVLRKTMEKNFTADELNAFSRELEKYRNRNPDEIQVREERRKMP